MSLPSHGIDREEVIHAQLQAGSAARRATQSSTPPVFGAWLDTKSPGGLWFGVERAIVNPVVDGLFYHAVKHEGRSWPHYGRFIRLDRGRTIEHTWVSEATRGLETVVTIPLAPRDGGTEVTLHHANVPDDEMGGDTRTDGRGI